jgi:hypothetical protein
MDRLIDRAGRRIRGAVALAALGGAMAAMAFVASPAMAADGTGTMTVSPTYVVSGSSGNFLTFTYTAGAGGVNNGKIAILVPTGWTTPDPDGFNPGGLSVPCTGDSPTVTSVSGGHLITIPEVSLTAGDTCVIRYGISGFNSGATAPSATGTSTFTTQEASSGTGTLTTIGSSPSVTVGNDGTGTMTVSPSQAVVSSAGNKLTFTYTAARTITSGQLTLAIPAGWSTPSTSAAAAGATTSTCGTVAVSGTTINVTGVSLASGGTCTVTYGNKASGPGATAPSAGGTLSFTTQEESTNDNNLVALPTSPQVIVTAADGAGTVAVSPNTLITSSPGNELDFTYTAPTGGLNDGTITLLVPTGWTTPDPDGFDPGGLSVPCTGDSATVTSVSGGHLITIPEVWLNAGGTCVIKYGINGFNSGVTAPATEGAYGFTMQEASSATGTLTTLGSSPVVTVGNDGTGAMTVSPLHAIAGTGGNTLTFTYTAARAISSGGLTVAIPAGWSTPSTSAAAAGATTSTCGTVGVTGSTIEVTGLNLVSGNTCTVTYGSRAGGPGATAPASGGTMTFTTQESSNSGGTLTTLGNGSPQVIVTAADGSGTMTVSPGNVITASTGNELDFTYTTPAGGLNNGELTILVPTGWTTPDPDGFDPGGLSVPCTGDSASVSSVAGGHLITIPGVYLNGGSTCVIRYGINGFNSGVTAPSTSGAYTFTTQEASSATGTPTSIGSSPRVNVGNDGTGTMTVSPAHAVVGSTGNTLTFTYTAATTVANGQLTLAIPAGWSAPSTTGTAAGASTSTCGTVSVAASTIQIGGVSLSSGATCKVVYGSRTSGPGAIAPSAGGPATFITQERSSSTGTLSVLGSPAPQVTAVSADGSGSMTVSPASVVNGSSRNQLTFTYTAATGGLSNGELTLVVPSGWSAPQASAPTQGGWTIAGCGSATTVSGSTIEVTGVTLSGGDTCTITYGDTFEGGSGATAPLPSGTSTFTAQAASTAAGPLTSLASSPVVNVDEDGIGTLTASPVSASAGAAGNTVTFSFTTAVAMSSGEVTIAVPSGWSAPSGTGASPGFTTTNCGGGSVGVSGNTIQVTGITAGSGTTCSIVYGDTSAGGRGATATSSPGVSAFVAQEKSSSAGTLAALATSPSVTVFAPDGSGTMTAGPTFAPVGSSGNTVTLTYTAASGGLRSGRLLVSVPSGWSAPSTTQSFPGYTTSSCGSVAISGSTIQVGGVTLAASATCTITYGNTSAGGTGASAPSSAGVSDFSTQEQSTGVGNVTAIAVSPQVDVTSSDGTGTVTVDTPTVGAGSGGNTLTFTFTAASGGTHGGTLALAVPAGWPSPSASASATGATTSTCGTVAVSGSAIQVTGVTVPGGATCTIVYGSKAAGGAGVTAPSSDVTTTFTASEMSTGVGMLTELAKSPSVTAATFPTSTVPTSGGGAGQAPGANTQRPPVLTCSLASVSARLAKTGKSRHASRNAVELIARCNQATSVTVAGTVTEQLPATGKHGKRRAQVFSLGRVRASLGATLARSLTLKLPAAAVRALEHGAKESAAFTLTASTPSATRRFTATIHALRL